MSKSLEAKAEQAVVRPLRVLVPLIKEDLRQGNEAGEPYYRAAGEKLLEAKGQLARGEWAPWVKRNFNISLKHSQRYMSFAIATADREKRRIGGFTNFSEFMREEGGDPGYGQVVRKQAWHEPVKKIISRVNVDALRQSELKRVEERDLQRKLALQLIDIGYKALATKLHPDRGGSRDAMARLNQVRDRLKGYA